MEQICSGLNAQGTKVYTRQRKFKAGVHVKAVLRSLITCDQAYFFWERRREEGEGKKITPDTFIVPRARPWPWP